MRRLVIGAGATACRHARPAEIPLAGPHDLVHSLNLNLTRIVDDAQVGREPSNRSPSPIGDANREGMEAAMPQEKDLVFPGGTGEIAFHQHIVERALKPAQVAAGIVKKDGTAKYTRLHALRHFYASWCINRTKDGGLGLPPKNV